MPTERMERIAGILELNSNSEPIVAYSATIKPGRVRAPAKQMGLSVNECVCGDTVWAFPWNDEVAAWEAHCRHPLRSYIEEKGLAPPVARISHHVIIASRRDADLVADRRWRVYPAKPWMPHEFELRGGGRGLPLHQHAMDRGKQVRVIDGNGCDVRRENLRPMTRNEIDKATRFRLLGKQV